jgi:hypothetical protein
MALDRIFLTDGDGWADERQEPDDVEYVSAALYNRLLDAVIAAGQEVSDHVMDGTRHDNGVGYLSGYANGLRFARNVYKRRIWGSDD